MSDDIRRRTAPTRTDRVSTTLAAVLGVDAGLLEDDAGPTVIPSWDSLNHLNVVLAIESEFGVSISVEEALALKSVAAIRSLLEARGVSV